MKRVLPVIVVAQFLCPSLWFAGNAVLPDMIRDDQLSPTFLAHLTSAVQFGFITGTLLFAVMALADRFSPSRVFFVCAWLAALCNAGMCLAFHGPGVLLLFRFLTGLFLAGIYPVGMKIAADHREKGLGQSLGFLVGALVLGTAFPHLLKGLAMHWPWQSVIYTLSGLAATGGLLMLVLVPDGPFRKPGLRLQFTSFLDGFRQPQFRTAAWGYFGHMWELYTFWAFVPVLLLTYQQQHPTAWGQGPLTAFLVIASGSVACVCSGILSLRLDAKRVATFALGASCLCCLLSPWVIQLAPPSVFLSFVVFWAMVVIADSPLFSALVAAHAPAETRGTALTIVNCLGFSITIISLQAIHALRPWMGDVHLYLALAIGPAVGLMALLRREKP